MFSKQDSYEYKGNKHIHQTVNYIYSEMRRNTIFKIWQQTKEHDRTRQ